MTQSNRFLNRVILFAIGIVAIALAALIVLSLFPTVAGRAGIDVKSWFATVPDMTRPSTLWVTAAALLVVVALSIAWIATRGRGRTSTALQQDDILVEDAAVASTLRNVLARDPDVLAVAAQGYRRSGGVVLVRIETRSRANLSAVLTRLRAAVTTLDSTIGTAVPLVIHLTTGIRTATTGSRITK